MSAEFHYRIPWRAHSAAPGHHRSSQTGGGYEFHGHAPLMTSPDPRNLDVHASLHDPFGQFMVRTFRQLSAIPVYLVADLSASLGFHRKMETLAGFAAGAAFSAYRGGDRFGFIGCGEAILWDLYLPLRWYKGGVPDLGERLRALKPAGRSAEGLLEAVPYLGRHRSLLFLATDFHFPLDFAERVLDAYSHHDIVPVVLWDTMEFERLPERGFARLCDPESGEERALFMRPALRRAFRERFEARREAIIHLCLRYGRQPFFLIDGFDPERLTRYFLEQ